MFGKNQQLFLYEIFYSPEVLHKCQIYVIWDMFLSVNFVYVEKCGKIQNIAFWREFCLGIFG